MLNSKKEERMSITIHERDPQARRKELKKNCAKLLAALLVLLDIAQLIYLMIVPGLLLDP